MTNLRGGKSRKNNKAREWRGAAKRGRESEREGPVRSVRSEGDVGDNGGRRQERKKESRLGDGGGTGGGWRGGSSQGTHACQCITQKHRGHAIEIGKIEGE